MKGSIVLLSCVVFSASFVYVVAYSPLLPIHMFKPRRLDDAWEESDKHKISAGNVNLHLKGSSSLGQSHSSQGQGSHNYEINGAMVGLLIGYLKRLGTNESMNMRFRFTHFNNEHQIEIVTSFMSHFTGQFLEGEVGNQIMMQDLYIQHELTNGQNFSEEELRTTLSKQCNIIDGILLMDKVSLLMWDEYNPNETPLQQFYKDKTDLSFNVKKKWHTTFRDTWKRISQNLVEVVAKGVVSSDPYVKALVGANDSSKPFVGELYGKLEQKLCVSIAIILELFALGLTYCYVYEAYYFRYQEGKSAYDFYSAKNELMNLEPNIYLMPSQELLLEYVDRKLKENSENQPDK